MNPSSDNWTHPDPNRDWSAYSSGRDHGVHITRNAKVDDDALDGATVIDVWVERAPYHFCQPCSHLERDEEQEQCKQDWPDDWDGSPYGKRTGLTGPSVAVNIRADD